MTAREIQKRLIIERYRRSFIIPNYTPSNWWECDLFEVTQAGYFREYEIKLTRSDFKADAKKTKRDWSYNDTLKKGEITHRAKHEELRKSVEHGPTQFWYVCPPMVIQWNEVPKFAGLIYVGVVDDRIQVKEMVKAPRLHRTKVEKSVVDHARGICYWRFHNVFLHGKISTEVDEP